MLPKLCSGDPPRGAGENICTLLPSISFCEMRPRWMYTLLRRNLPDSFMNEHRRILVVDDESQITRVLRTSLSSQGYDIRVANDGETALEIMKDWTPDLVITDLSMPNMDGLELCRRLRLLTEIPIIVLSVKGEERSKVKALDAGADDYVTKPFGIEE